MNLFLNKIRDTKSRKNFIIRNLHYERKRVFLSIKLTYFNDHLSIGLKSSHLDLEINFKRVYSKKLRHILSSSKRNKFLQGKRMRLNIN